MLSSQWGIVRPLSPIGYSSIGSLNIIELDAWFILVCLCCQTLFVRCFGCILNYLLLWAGNVVTKNRFYK